MGNIGAAVSQPDYNVKNSGDRFKVFSSSFQTLKIYNTYTASGDVPSGNTGVFTVDTGTNVFTDTAHGLSDGDQVTFYEDGTLPAPLAENTVYYIISSAANTFKVSLTEGGSEVDITTSGSGSNEWENLTTVLYVNHNIGYLAPFIAINNGNSVDGTDDSHFMSGKFTIPTYSQKANTLEIPIDSGFDSLAAGTTVYWTIYVFLDDFREVSIDNIDSTSTTNSTGDDYGFKVSKPGIEVKEADDTELQLSSAFSNLVIHKKGTSTDSSVAHDLSYIPAYLSFIKYSGSSELSYVPTLFSVDTSNINFSLSSGDTAYYIIFKQTV